VKYRFSILLITILCCATQAFAQFHKSTDKRANHYITMALAGGESNTFTSFTDDAPSLRDMPGADALFALTYEVRKGKFFVGLGAQADYDFTWQKADSFIHEFDRRDREYDEIIYGYRYTDYRDYQHNLQLSIPLYVGGNIGHSMYFLAGAKVSLSFLGRHHTNTLLSTEGTYVRFIHTIRNAPTYGYYYQDEYDYRDAWETPSIKISPMAELGARIPIESRSHRIGMRLGAYVEYGIPLSANRQMEMVDYSRVDASPFTQNQDDLRRNIVFNSILNSTYQQKAFSQLTIGIKWTVLFNITPPEHVCMCDGEL